MDSQNKSRFNLMIKICLYSFCVLMLFKACHREIKINEGIPWITQLDSALVVARESGKPVMIDFMATWCPPCQKMEDSTFNQSLLIDKAASFIPVRIDVDLQEDVANHYNSNAGKYGGIGIPNILFLSSEGERIHQIIGFHSAEELITVMDSISHHIKHPTN